MNTIPGGYFDYAAATPLNPDVLAAMAPFFGEHFYNPSAQYAPAIETKRLLHQARASITHILGVKPAEIIFTGGGTEANNLAIRGIMEKYPSANVIISSVEHDSVRIPAGKYEVREVAVDEKGIVDITSLTNAIDENTVIVSVMYANNEVGTVQPIRKIAQELELIRKYRLTSGNALPLLFHTDAAQAANYLDLHVHRLGVDMMSLNGGKIYGPKQSGILYVKGGVALEPLILGGGQEKSLRSGTENVPAIIGFAKSLELSASLRHAETERLQKLQKQFIEVICERFPDVAINGSTKNRLPNNVHITIPGQDNERLLMQLDERHIYAAAGSACSASHEESSHVLKAMGLPEAHIRESIRFTMGRYTDSEDITNVVNVLSDLLA